MRARREQHGPLPGAERAAAHAERRRGEHTEFEPRGYLPVLEPEVKRAAVGEPRIESRHRVCPDAHLQLQRMRRGRSQRCQDLWRRSNGARGWRGLRPRGGDGLRLGAAAGRERERVDGDAQGERDGLRKLLAVRLLGHQLARARRLAGAVLHIDASTQGLSELLDPAGDHPRRRVVEGIEPDPLADRGPQRGLVGTGLGAHVPLVDEPCGGHWARRIICRGGRACHEQVDNHHPAAKRHRQHNTREQTLRESERVSKPSPRDGQRRAQDVVPTSFP